MQGTEVFGRDAVSPQPNTNLKEQRKKLQLHDTTQNTVRNQVRFPKI